MTDEPMLPGIELPMEPPSPVAMGEGLAATVDSIFESSLPNITLTAGQDEALEAVKRMMQRSGPGFCFIVGFAGTGKTTMMRVIGRDCGKPIVVCPTGKAALRVREATRLEAQTIHRWMYKPIEDLRNGTIKFVKRSADDIAVPPSRLILLDEASMVGPEVWRDLYETVVNFNLKLVCIGDGFQLPPVQPRDAAPFSLLEPDFAESLQAERIELTEVLRQAQDSPVVRVSMALRNGEGYRALLGLPRVYDRDIGITALRTYQAGGILICHTNNQRYKLNACMRTALGISAVMPQPGEPLLVLKNTYEVGLHNGEATAFTSWAKEPITEDTTRVSDRFKGTEEFVHFGAMPIEFTALDSSPAKINVTIALEELWGQLQAGFGATIKAAKGWSQANGFIPSATPYLPVNFGYCYTAHKSQGSEWPWVLVVLEPSIDLGGEEGRRWAYTAVTRAKTLAAVYFGRV